jgi:hypothetical protein
VKGRRTARAAEAEKLCKMHIATVLTQTKTPVLPENFASAEESLQQQRESVSEINRKIAHLPQRRHRRTKLPLFCSSHTAAAGTLSTFFDPASPVLHFGRVRIPNTYMTDPVPPSW